MYRMVIDMICLYCSDSLVAQHQRTLLDITYYGDRDNRDKFTLILAEEVEPRMRAAKYLDKEDYENELKQVLGDTHAAHDLGRISASNESAEVCLLIITMSAEGL